MNKNRFIYYLIGIGLCASLLGGGPERLQVMVEVVNVATIKVVNIAGLLVMLLLEFKLKINQFNFFIKIIFYYFLIYYIYLLVFKLLLNLYLFFTCFTPSSIPVLLSGSSRLLEGEDWCTRRRRETRMPSLTRRVSTSSVVRVVLSGALAVVVVDVLMSPSGVRTFSTTTVVLLLAAAFSRPLPSGNNNGVNGGVLGCGVLSQFRMKRKKPDRRCWP
jgi:hypothetical protein